MWNILVVKKDNLKENFISQLLHTRHMKKVITPQMMRDAA